MKIVFIGVGEAFEPSLGNSSYLIQSSQTVLLIDCGYAVPRNFFEIIQDCELVDGLYLTHFHADHCWGLPALLYRWTQEKRSKPLIIIGQTRTEKHVNQLLDLAYPRMREKLSFELKFIEADEHASINELSLSFAETAHSLRNLAIRIDGPQCSIGISGDGDFTEASKQLFYPCQILIHETFTLNGEVKGHTNLTTVLDYAKSMPNLKTLACVHISREERQRCLKICQEWQQALPFTLIIPSPNETL